MTFTEVGPDVVVTLTGQINTTGLSPDVPFASGPRMGIAPKFASLFFSEGTDMIYFIAPFVSPPRNYGTGLPFLVEPSNWSGSLFGLSSAGGSVRDLLYVPADYVSNTSLAGTGSFVGQSFSTLGLKRGSHVWTLTNQDTVTLQVGGIPEPSTWMMMILGFGLIAQQLRGRFRAVV